MRIQEIDISGFRSIRSCSIVLQPYTVFVGKNNSGKSNIMKALDAFFNDIHSKDDFFKEPSGKGTASEIEITVTFVDLSAAECDKFKEYIREDKPGGNKSLVVKKTISPGGSRFEAIVPVPDLDSEETAKLEWFFKLKANKPKKKDFEGDTTIPGDFKEFVEKFLKEQKLKWVDFPKALEAYEKKHPGMLKNVQMKDGTVEMNIPKTKAKEYFGNYIFVPAVQDVEKETRYQARGKTGISALMHSVMEHLKVPREVEKLSAEIAERLRGFYDFDGEGSRMREVQELLNEELGRFDDTKVRFDAFVPNLDDILRSSLQVYVDDGVETPAEYKGHGLQRYFMVALFKLLAKNAVEKKNNEDNGEYKAISTIFAIEEPELFLHPQYQRIMKSYLKEICDTGNFQVLLNTHSPHFIEFDEIHTLVKVIKPSLAEGTKVIQVPEKKPKELVHVHGKKREVRQKYTRINTLNMNYYLNPTRNEIFFADKVVLVEGQTEKIMFQAWAEYFIGDPSLLNSVTYVDCLGKFNIQNYCELLNAFKMDYVVIIDTDQQDDAKNAGKVSGGGVHGRGDRVAKSPQPGTLADGGGKITSTAEDSNPYIWRDAEKGNAKVFVLEPDFEGEFGIRESEVRDGKKKNKPYYAFKQFFDVFTGEPVEEELNKIRENKKLNQIFKEIYGKTIPSS